MNRNFLTLLVLAVFTITAGGMACIGQREPDRTDETDGAT